jgi:hypothetical protein
MEINTFFDMMLENLAGSFELCRYRV